MVRHKSTPIQPKRTGLMASSRTYIELWDWYDCVTPHHRILHITYQPARCNTLTTLVMGVYFLHDFRHAVQKSPKATTSVCTTETVYEPPTRNRMAAYDWLTWNKLPKWPSAWPLADAYGNNKFRFDLQQSLFDKNIVLLTQSRFNFRKLCYRIVLNKRI